MRHGETGTVLLTTVLPGALLIPQEATFDVLDKKFVLVVGRGGVVHAREIAVAEELPHLFILRSGLRADERFLLEGLRTVSEGDHIAPVVRDAADVCAHLDIHAE
jgi:membrane fusion protein, multidrug efflux system